MLTCQFERKASNEGIWHSLSWVQWVAEVEGARSKVERMKRLMSCNNQNCGYGMLVHPCPCEPVWRAAEYSLMMEAENVSETLNFCLEITRLLPEKVLPSGNDYSLILEADMISEMLDFSSEVTQLFLRRFNNKRKIIP